MKVKVTQEHIKKGIRCSAAYCPVALSLKEKGMTRVSVYTHNARMGGDYYRIRRGSRFIERFDSGLPVEPCTVEITWA